MKEASIAIRVAINDKFVGRCPDSIGSRVTMDFERIEIQRRES